MFEQAIIASFVVMGLAIAQDSTAVFPPSVPLGSGATILIGIGAAFGTALVGRIGTKLDELTGNTDAKIRKRIGPALPVVAVGMSIVLPMLGNALGITDLPEADVVAGAPTAAIAGIVLREITRRFILPSRFRS